MILLILLIAAVSAHYPAYGPPPPPPAVVVPRRPATYWPRPPPNRVGRTYVPPHPEWPVPPAGPFRSGWYPIGPRVARPLNSCAGPIKRPLVPGIVQSPYWRPVYPYRPVRPVYPGYPVRPVLPVRPFVRPVWPVRPVYPVVRPGYPVVRPVWPYHRPRLVYPVRPAYPLPRPVPVVPVTRPVYPLPPPHLPLRPYPYRHRVPGVCDRGFIFWKGHCYFASKREVSYPEAAMQCLKMGSALVSVHSPLENEFVNNLAKTKHVWIGFQKVRGVWVWADRSPVVYDDWGRHQPNGCCGIDVKCTASDPLKLAGKWFDTDCKSPLSFVCKYDPMFRPPTVVPVPRGPLARPFPVPHRAPVYWKKK